MLLSELLKGLNVIKSNVKEETEIKSICSDSRELSENAAFICISGTSFDGQTGFLEVTDLNALTDCHNHHIRRNVEHDHIAEEPGSGGNQKIAVDVGKAGQCLFRIGHIQKIQIGPVIPPDQLHPLNIPIGIGIGFDFTVHLLHLPIYFG